MAYDPNLTITPAIIPPGRRLAVQASTRLLHEWAQMQPWLSPPRYELRLGPTRMNVNAAPLTPAVEQLLRRANWYADLVGQTAQGVLVVEAKVVANPAAVGQLEHYVQLISTTPELRQFAGQPVIPVLLVAVNDDSVDRLAKAHGMRVDVYSPAWVNEYLLSKYFRRRQIQSAETALAEGENTPPPETDTEPSGST